MLNEQQIIEISEISFCVAVSALWLISPIHSDVSNPIMQRLGGGNHVCVLGPILA